MEALLALVLVPLLLAPFVLPVVFFLLSRARIERLEHAQQAWRQQMRADLEQLSTRLERLEAQPSPVEDAALATPAPVREPPPPELTVPLGPAVPVESTAPLETPAPLESPAPAEPIAPPKTTPPPEPTAPVAVSSPGAAADLESVIGSSWLNRIGVLVLVIGLALTVGYAFTSTGPAGRVMIGYLTAAAMMAGGVVAERREPYRHYGHGLIGGAWAAAYFTTYAMHWLAASRLVSSPLLGILLLFGVSIGMIAHSLRYRSEAVSGTAFVVGFATLAVSPASRFSLIALVPLALALLVVSRRQQWVRLPILGAVVTYVVYTFGEGSLPHAATPLAVFVLGQSVLTVCWVVFESFDLMRRRGPVPPQPADGLSSLLSPINALGFAAASILQWMSLAPELLGHFFALAAGLFGIVAIARTLLPLPSTDDPAQQIVDSFRGPLTIAAVMTTLAFHERFDGYTLTVAFLLQAQALLTLAMGLRDRYVRGLAGIAFAVALLKLLLPDFLAGSGATFIGLQEWSLMALASLAVLYADRFWIARRGGVYWELEQLYSWLATLLLFLVVIVEMPARTVEISWFALATVLLEIGLASRRLELRAQAYVGFVLALGVTWLRIGPGETVTSLDLWGVAAPVTLGAWLLGARLRRGPATAEHDCRFAATGAWLAGSILLLTLLWRALPPVWVAPAWAAFWLGGLLLAEDSGKLFRVGGHALVLAVWVRCWQLHLAPASEIEPRALAALALVAICLVVGRVVQHRRQLASAAGLMDPALAWLPPVAATTLVVVTLVRAVDGSLLTVALGVYGALLLALGFATADRLQRMSGLVVLGICLIKAFAYDLRALTPLFRILSFVVLGLVLLGVSLLYTRSRAQEQRDL